MNTQDHANSPPYLPSPSKGRRRPLEMTTSSVIGGFVGLSEACNGVGGVGIFLAATAICEPFADGGQQLVDLRNLGLKWNAISTKVGGTPQALRKKLARALDRVAKELGLDPPNVK